MEEAKIHGGLDDKKINPNNLHEKFDIDKSGVLDIISTVEIKNYNWRITSKETKGVSFFI